MHVSLLNERLTSPFRGIGCWHHSVNVYSPFRFLPLRLWHLLDCDSQDTKFQIGADCAIISIVCQRHFSVKVTKVTLVHSLIPTSA